MVRRVPSWLVVLAACLSLTSGCDPLALRPGQHFQVSWLEEGPLPVHAWSETTPLVFQVKGCASFEAEVETATGGEQRLLKLDVRPRDDGLYEADVPRAAFLAFRPGETCGHPAAFPFQYGFRVRVLCLDGGGSRTTPDRKAEFSNARQVLRPRNWSSEVHLVAANGEGDEVALFTNTHVELFTGQASLEPFAGGPLPFFGRSESVVRVEARRITAQHPCEGVRCAQKSVPRTDGTSALLNVGTLASVTYPSESETWSPTSISEVPGSWRHMASATDGARLFLDSKNRFMREEEGQFTLYEEMGGLNAGNGFAKRPDGAVRFLTANETTSRLSLRTETAAVDAERALPAFGRVFHVSTSPDGSLWAVFRETHLYAGGWDDGPLLELAMRDVAPSEVHIGWTQDFLVVLTRDSLQAFERAAPFARRFEVPLTGGGLPVGLRTTDDRMIVTTTRGVRIFSSEGRAVGGAFPLPCSLEPAVPATPLGSDGALLPLGSDVLVLGSEPR